MSNGPRARGRQRHHRRRKSDREAADAAAAAGRHGVDDTGPALCDEATEPTAEERASVSTGRAMTPSRTPTVGDGARFQADSEGSNRW